MSTPPSIAAGVSGYTQRLAINAAFLAAWQAMQTNDANFCTTTGTSPTFAAAVTPAPGALTLGMELVLKFHAGSTAACTLNVNGLGAVSLKQVDGAWSKTPFLPIIGQIVHVIYDGTDWVVSSLPSQISHGNCILTLSSGSLVLKPYRGNGLIINGQTCTIPSTGVSLAVTGMTAGTLYYIYAYMNSGTMTLEKSATAHATHTDGVEIKSGDATRTLVGMARPVAGPAFSATQNCMLVRSWFNRTTAERRPRSLQPAEISRNNTNYAEVGTTTRVEFLVWSDEQVSLSGLPCIKGTITIDGYAKLMLDGDDILTYRSTFERRAAAETNPTYRYQIFGGSSTYQATTMPTKVLLERMPLVLTEGYHYTSIWINGSPCCLGEDSSRAYGNTEIVIEKL